MSLKTAIAIAAAVWFGTHEHASAAPQWGLPFARGECTDRGVRVYSARLWDIPFGQSWDKACHETPADIAGHHFDSPSRCIETPKGVAEWGEFDVPDATCPHWGELAKFGCYEKLGMRVVGAVLWDIPAGVDAMTFCERTPNLEVQVLSDQERYPHCFFHADGHIWGEWYVRDTSCPWVESGLLVQCEAPANSGCNGSCLLKTLDGKSTGICNVFPADCRCSCATLQRVGPCVPGETARKRDAAASKEKRSTLDKSTIPAQDVHQAPSFKTDTKVNKQNATHKN